MQKTIPDLSTRADWEGFSTICAWPSPSAVLCLGLGYVTGGLAVNVSQPLQRLECRKQAQPLPKVTVLGRLDQRCSESWSSSRVVLFSQSLRSRGPEKVNGLGRSHRGSGGGGSLHFQLQICGGWLDSPEHQAG